MGKFIYTTGVTYFCLPGAHPLIRSSMTDTTSNHFAKWLLSQLSLETDIIRGCYW